jgi:SAM-dependent methyltransferase
MSDVNDIGYGRQFADFYDRLYPPGELVEQTVERLASLHPGDGQKSLELGVGTGRIAVPLALRTGPVVGVDSSPEMLDVLRANAAAAPGLVTPVLGDLRHYADGDRYGLVYCVCATLSMLLTAADQQQALKVCARAVMPGGAVVIETHNPAAVEALHQGRERESYFVPYPGRDQGLLTCSTLQPGGPIWQVSHVWFEDGRSRVTSETSRLSTPAEVDGFAAAAGLQLQARYGAWTGAPFTGTEPEVISIYRSQGREPGDHDAEGRPSQ